MDRRHIARCGSWSTGQVLFIVGRLFASWYFCPFWRWPRIAPCCPVIGPCRSPGRGARVTKISRWQSFRLRYVSRLIWWRERRAELRNEWAIRRWCEDDVIIASLVTIAGYRTVCWTDAWREHLADAYSIWHRFVLSNESMNRIF